MIGNDTHSVYHFGYPQSRALPDLTTKVNYFDDLNKNMHFLFNRLRILHRLFTHFINEPDSRSAKSGEDGVFAISCCSFAY